MLKLPESLRGELARPHGKVYRDGEGIFKKIDEIKRGSK